MTKLLAILAIGAIIFGCSGRNVKQLLKVQLEDDLKIQVTSIKPLVSYEKTTEKKVIKDSSMVDGKLVVTDSVVTIEVVDSILVPVDSLLIAKPNYQIRKYEMVTGTLITKLAIVDFHYIRPDKFDVFQRRVYRYNESIKNWEIHKKYMLKNSLVDDELDKYLTLN